MRLSVKSVYRLIPETHQGEVSELLDIVKHGRGINRYESKRMRKDGQLFDVSASLSPIRDLHGNVIGAATITRDITLLRKGEEQLLAYTDQLETLNLVVAGDCRNALGRGSYRPEFEPIGFNQWLRFRLRAFFRGRLRGRKFYGASVGSHSMSELSDKFGRNSGRIRAVFLAVRNPGLSMTWLRRRSWPRPPPTAESGRSRCCRSRMRRRCARRSH